MERAISSAGWNYRTRGGSPECGRRGGSPECGQRSGSAESDNMAVPRMGLRSGGICIIIKSRKLVGTHLKIREEQEDRI